MENGVCHSWLCQLHEKNSCRNPVWNKNNMLLYNFLQQVIKWREQYCVYFSVTARIRNLHDYQLRLLHNIMPVPSGVDIANTLKYFSQTLLSKCTYSFLSPYSNTVNLWDDTHCNFACQLCWRMSQALQWKCWSLRKRILYVLDYIPFWIIKDSTVPLYS